MDNRNRNTAILLICAGAYLLLGNLISFLTVSAIVLIWLGLYKVRTDGDSKGYIVLAIGGLLLFGDQFIIVIAIILISLGYFLIKSRKMHRDDKYSQNQTIIESIQWDREPWVLKSMSRWSIIGEARMDLSFAIQDEPEPIVVLQGIIGNIDVIVPEDYGLTIEANVIVGRIGIGEEKDSGMLNKRIWQSANYEGCEHKLKLIIDYAVADVEVKIL